MREEDFLRGEYLYLLQHSRRRRNMDRHIIPNTLSLTKKELDGFQKTYELTDDQLKRVLDGWYQIHVRQQVYPKVEAVTYERN